VVVGLGYESSYIDNMHVSLHVDSQNKIEITINTKSRSCLRVNGNGNNIKTKTANIRTRISVVQYVVISAMCSSSSDI